MQANFFRALIFLILTSSFTMTSCQDGAERVAEEVAKQFGSRSQPGTKMGIYTPEQHERYSGHFHITGNDIYQVGRLLNDPPGWDHMDNEAKGVHAVQGMVELDVDEIDNTGTFIAHFNLPEGDLVIEMDRFHDFSLCQSGGVAAYFFGHGDSGCGDPHWPKSFVYVAGWGYGHATLNGKELYENYRMHFMVTQGMRDRATLKVYYPLLNKKSLAGAVDPAAQQLDFYMRSPEINPRNEPPREVFHHFFAMEVTWK